MSKPCSRRFVALHPILSIATCGAAARFLQQSALRLNQIALFLPHCSIFHIDTRSSFSSSSSFSPCLLTPPTHKCSEAALSILRSASLLSPVLALTYEHSPHFSFHPDTPSPSPASISPRSHHTHCSQRHLRRRQNAARVGHGAGQCRVPEGRGGGGEGG